MESGGEAMVAAMIIREKEIDFTNDISGWQRDGFPLPSHESLNVRALRARIYSGSENTIAIINMNGEGGWSHQKSLTHRW